MNISDLNNLYIAHRGIQKDNTIENTIPAFSLAISKKVPIEFDLHILKDGAIVVFHDDNLKRLIGIDKNIEDYSYNELKEITFPSTNIHIPLFTEVLKLVDGKVLIIIEIKRSFKTNYCNYCKKISKILDDYKCDFMIKSFDIRIVYWFLHNTSYTTGLLIANRKKSFYDLLMRQSILLWCLKPDFLSVDYHILDCYAIKRYRLEKPVLTWTINNYEIMNKVKSKADGYLIEKFYF